MKKERKRSSKREKLQLIQWNLSFITVRCWKRRKKEKKRQKIELCELSDTTVIKALTPFSLEIEKRLDKNVYSIKI